MLIGSTATSRSPKGGRAKVEGQIVPPTKWGKPLRRSNVGEAKDSGPTRAWRTSKAGASRRTLPNQGWGSANLSRAVTTEGGKASHNRES